MVGSDQGVQSLQCCDCAINSVLWDVWGLPAFPVPKDTNHQGYPIVGGPQWPGVAFGAATLTQDGLSANMD